MNNTEIAKKVIEAIGGVENVSSVAHCATRLRVMVKDESIIDKDTVENLKKYKVLSSTQVNTKSSLVLVQLTKFMTKLSHLACQQQQHLK